MSSLQDDGLSHSEISGSKVICTYPELIAAYHVLHRLREPRHPPCALNYFLLLFYGFALWFPFPMREAATAKAVASDIYFQLFFSFILLLYNMSKTVW